MGAVASLGSRAGKAETNRRLAGHIAQALNVIGRSLLLSAP